MGASRTDPPRFNPPTRTKNPSPSCGRGGRRACPRAAVGGGRGRSPRPTQALTRSAPSSACGGGLGWGRADQAVPPKVPHPTPLQPQTARSALPRLASTDPTPHAADSTMNAADSTLSAADSTPHSAARTLRSADSTPRSADSTLRSARPTPHSANPTPCAAHRTLRAASITLHAANPTLPSARSTRSVPSRRPRTPAQPIAPARFPPADAFQRTPNEAGRPKAACHTH